MNLTRSFRAGGISCRFFEKVVSAEPVHADNPLLSAKNCILTPHISWAPLESRQRIMDITAANIQAFLNGAPQNVVNK